MASDGHEIAIPLITDPAAAGVSARSKAASYFALTKPRIIELLLITTVPSMVLAAGRWPGVWPVLATLIGGSLSAGGANALNNYVDRDIDQIMKRTRSRPLARHEVPPSNALVLGVALGVAGFAWLWATTNLLAATIATAALLFYVFVYTLKLKRTSTQNIVIGGAAGAAPTLVGWAAVTGSLDLPAWVLFLVVFYWTPPHFWALAIRYRDDYEKAGVPMLPVVAGVEATTRKMLLYTGLMVGISLLLVPVAGMRWIYLGAAIALGAWFLWDTWRVFRRPEDAMRLFTTSTVYLAALFGAVMLDVLVR
ncbi:MAG TPA: heme o synthase [Acidimicrobiia bacterium]|nr:protoheme farnesyltransferase [Acidimicrobiia bacterium]HYJ23679.1 heme o synthase [Acidimicrobiia bacterium]